MSHFNTSRITLKAVWDNSDLRTRNCHFYMTFVSSDCVCRPRALWGKRHSTLSFQRPQMFKTQIRCTLPAKSHFFRNILMLRGNKSRIWKCLQLILWFFKCFPRLLWSRYTMTKSECNGGKNCEDSWRDNCVILEDNLDGINVYDS